MRLIYVLKANNHSEMMPWLLGKKLKHMSKDKKLILMCQKNKYWEMVRETRFKRGGQIT